MPDQIDNGRSDAGLELLLSPDIDELLEGIDRSTEAAPSYRRLYSRWESQQWSTEQFDLSEDARQWREETDEQAREYTLWSMSSFFCGEERVTTELLPFAIAAPTDEARAYLATQIADEARHTMFFDRFYREVFGLTAADLTEQLAHQRPRMNEAWGDLFEGILCEVATRLRLDPSDRRALWEGVTVYMIVIEGTLALTGTRFIMRGLRDQGRFPGFREAFTCVTRDESRHVGFGVRLLHDAVREDPAAVDVIESTLQRVLPVASGALVPPWADDPHDFTDPITGVHSSEMFDYAASCLRKRLAAIGLGREGTTDEAEAGAMA